MNTDGVRNKLAEIINRMPIVRALRGEDESDWSKNGLMRALKGMPVFDSNPQSAYDAAMQIGPMGLGKIVYHGSPHKFDKFDASKIGTGEGAQAYGHGVYLADAEDVAKGYQKTLAYKAFDLGQEAEKRGVKLSAGARGEFHRQAAANSDPMRAAMGLQNANISARELPQEKLAELFDAFQKDGTGALYKADLPDEWIPKMLDWDKPLSQQPENVRLMAQDFGLSGDATGKDIYYALSHQARDIGIIKGQPLQTTLPGSQEKATADLLGFGVPGIRYMDGGSRMTPTQEESIKKALERAMARGDEGVAKSLRAQLENRTSNYVVFPGLEDQVKILERNGQPVNVLADMLGSARR